ncbi:MAG: hypothetical protein EAZ88_09380 [Oscillatoriales cyanobacterium]|nr:MAG: hypothetical protein EAZ88_09380 [Oscillatoriales cyanobacterium]
MELEVVDVFDIEGVECDRVQSESIHESIYREGKSIQPSWVSSAEALHRTKLKNKSALQQAMSKLLNAHFVPVSLLRRGEARNTEYSQLAIDLIKAMRCPDKTEFERLKANILPAETAAVVSVVAPIKFKQDADNQLAIASSQIVDLRQAAQLRLAQLKQLHRQWQEAEKAEEVAQIKDLEAQEAQWDLQCVEEVMREETYKKNRKRELKQMLRNSTEVI